MKQRTKCIHGEYNKGLHLRNYYYDNPDPDHNPGLYGLQMTSGSEFDQKVYPQHCFLWQRFFQCESCSLKILVHIFTSEMSSVLLTISSCTPCACLSSNHIRVWTDHRVHYYSVSIYQNFYHKNFL